MNRKYINYFDYYLELEKDVFNTESYVTIEEDNYKTYSIQYAKLYLSICSEIDCLLKEICRNINSDTTANKINLYYPIVNGAFENFKQEGVYFKKQKIELYPWKKWEESSSPKWWYYYNKVKHQRLELEPDTNIPYYKFANLENVLNALAALYIVEQYYLYSYNYLPEVVIQSESEEGNMSPTELADNEKAFAMYEFTSKKCFMKRWKENYCYLSTYSEQYVDLDKLDYIMHNNS